MKKRKENGGEVEGYLAVVCDCSSSFGHKHGRSMRVERPLSAHLGTHLSDLCHRYLSEVFYYPRGFSMN